MAIASGVRIASPRSAGYDGFGVADDSAEPQEAAPRRVGEIAKA